MDKKNVFVEFEASDEWAIRNLPNFITCKDYHEKEISAVHQREWGCIETTNCIIRFLCYVPCSKK